MSREDIEADGTISPIGKLIVEWLSRKAERIHGATEVGIALGLHGSIVAEEAHGLRRKGLLDRMLASRPLQLAELHLPQHVRALYAPKGTK